MKSLCSVSIIIVALLIALISGTAVYAGDDPGQLQQRIVALEAAVQALTNTSSSLLSQLQTAQGQISTLQTALAAVQANHALALGLYVSVDSTTINGLVGPHIIFTGANLHVRSGSGATADTCTTNPCAGGTLTGLGNLLVGYNEEPTLPGLAAGDRGGSHNLITGRRHRYLNFGGLVVGQQNKISGPEASITGGDRNTASGLEASVTGGTGNEASGPSSSVSGGFLNHATNSDASISGGNNNTASGVISSVSGGKDRTASGTDSWAAGALSQPN